MRVGIIGHFGGDKTFNDGQTVKVKSLYTGLKKVIPHVKIDIVDTYYIHNKNPKVLLSIINCLLRDSIIVFLPATNGRKYLFKFLYYVKKITKKKIFHDAIGGALVDELKEHPEWKKYLCSFDMNWMESAYQVEQLINNGIKNVKYIPNFKRLNPIEPIEHEINYSEPFKLCMFCRVEEMKGISDAIEAIECINDTYERSIVKLDIYGPIQPGSEQWFDELLNRHSLNCNYCGCVDSSKSVEVLKDYFLLLFPTRYYTEGMPGTIIDAMFAGLPVLARKWAYCDQMITEDYNGFTYEFDKPFLLEKRIRELINAPQKVASLKNNCITEANKYREETVIQLITRDMGIEKSI